jgi:hypothetical protein
MKTSTLLKHLLFADCLLLANLAAAQGTAFTYQGNLNNTNGPVTGSYDLTFALYDDGTAGSLIAGPLTNVATVVSNGAFSATIDFGAGVFTGTNYWLEIGAQTNGGSDYATLAPRQQITPTPYAIYAANAGNAASVAANSVTADELFTLVPPVDGQVLSFTGGSLSWTDPAVAGGSVWSLNGSSAYYSAGGVGIGTASPLSKFHVVSGASDLPPRLQSSGTSSFGSGWDLYHGAIGVGYVGVPDSAAGIAPGELLMFGGSGTPVSLWPGGLRALTLATSGSVGIGTASPQAKLHLFDPNSVTGLIETGGGVNAWTRLSFKNADGQWDVGTSQSFNGDQLYFYREGAAANAFAIQPNGNAAFAGSLGIGTTSPQFALDVNGAARAGSGLLVTGASSPNYPNTKGVYIEKEDYGTGGSYGAVYAFNYNNPGPHAMSLCLNSPGGFVGIGTITPAYTLDVNGTTRTHSIIITGGADVAEPFKMGTGEIQKGSVMVIDEEHPGELKLSSTAYDLHVAGIVSGANGINPGIALQQEGALEGGQNVALSGRVYVLADASYGAIKPGDMLTTSGTPGHAMKVSDHSRAQGAILGKAMSGLGKGTGMVLVLVTLQ